MGAVLRESCSLRCKLHLVGRVHLSHEPIATIPGTRPSLRRSQCRIGTYATQTLDPDKHSWSLEHSLPLRLLPNVRHSVMRVAYICGTTCLYLSFTSFVLYL